MTTIYIKATDISQAYADIENISNLKEMNTMKPETMHGEWIVIDGAYGVSLYPGEYFNESEAKAEYGGRVYECERIAGWAARLSMPGFIDATEWHGPYDSEAEALRDLEALYER